MQSSLPHSMLETPLDILCQNDYLKALTSSYKATSERRIKIIPVIRDKDSPAKSGPSVARLYRRDLNILDEHMTWPWLIDKCYEEGSRVFVFIDDIVATGNQFC